MLKFGKQLYLMSPLVNNINFNYSKKHKRKVIRNAAKFVAKDSFEQGIKQMDNDSYLAMGYLDHTIELLECLGEDKNLLSNAYAYKGRILSDSIDIKVKDNAIINLKKALKINPENKFAKESLDGLYYDKGELYKTINVIIKSTPLVIGGINEIIKKCYL